MVIEISNEHHKHRVDEVVSMGWALRKFVKMTRLAPLRIWKIKKGVDKKQAIIIIIILYTSITPYMLTSTFIYVHTMIEFLIDT